PPDPRPPDGGPGSGLRPRTPWGVPRRALTGAGPAATMAPRRAAPPPPAPRTTVTDRHHRGPEPNLRRWIDRRPLALSVAVGLVALLVGAPRPDRWPPLFAAGLLGNRDALVSVPPGAVDGAVYLEDSTVLRLADGRLRDLGRKGG